MPVKSVYAVLLSVLCLGVAAGCTSSNETQVPTPDSLHIAAVYNLEGPLSPLEIPGYRGSVLAAREINAAGGVNGKMIALDVLNAKSSTDTLQAIVSKAAQSGKTIAFVGLTDTDPATTVATIAAQHHIPFLTIGATSPTLPSTSRNTTYLACFTDNLQASAAAEFVHDSLDLVVNGASAPVIVYDSNNTYTVLLAKYFGERFADFLPMPYAQIPYPFRRTDYSGVISQIQSNPNVPFIFLSAMPDDVGTIIKQFRDAGIMVPIIGGDGYDTPDLAAIAGVSSNDVYFTTHALISSSNPLTPVQKFMSSYKNMYGEDASSSFSALGYDGVGMLAAAIHNAHSTSADSVMSALGALSYSGVTGSISGLATTHIPLKPATVVRMVNGVQTFAGQVVPRKVVAP